jgi:hypothetical protein
VQPETKDLELRELCEMVKSYENQMRELQNQLEIQIQYAKESEYRHNREI